MFSIGPNEIVYVEWFRLLRKLQQNCVWWRQIGRIGVDLTRLMFYPSAAIFPTSFKSDEAFRINMSDKTEHMGLVSGNNLKAEAAF